MIREPGKSAKGQLFLAAVLSVAGACGKRMAEPQAVPAPAVPSLPAPKVEAAPPNPEEPVPARIQREIDSAVKLTPGATTGMAGLRPVLTCVEKDSLGNGVPILGS